MRSRALLVSAVLAAGAVGLALAASRGAAAAGGSALTVQAAFGTETWYQRDPACGTPAGCSPVTPPAQNPYGAGTLHVAVTAGSEVARSYLAVAPVTASGGAALTGAVLTVPLDTATAGNGSLAPETATVGVCTSSAALTAPEGSYDPPPGTSCAGEATLTYTATPAPALVADLSSLLPTLARQLPAGIDLALLPLDPAATASWHAVASSDARATLPVPPPSLALTYTAPGSVAPVQAAPSSAPGGGTVADPRRVGRRRGADAGLVPACRPAAVCPPRVACGVGPCVHTCDGPCDGACRHPYRHVPARAGRPPGRPPGRPRRAGRAADGRRLAAVGATRDAWRERVDGDGSADTGVRRAASRSRRGRPASGRRSCAVRGLGPCRADGDDRLRLPRRAAAAAAPRGRRRAPRAHHDA